MREPATVDEIETWLGFSLPDEYREFLKTCEVVLVASDIVVLYGRSTLCPSGEPV